jgi:hypothetical protein
MPQRVRLQFDIITLLSYRIEVSMLYASKQEI